MSDLSLDDLERLLELANKHGVEHIAFGGAVVRLRPQAPGPPQRERQQPGASKRAEPTLDEKIDSDPAYERFVHGLPVR